MIIYHIDKYETNDSTGLSQKSIKDLKRKTVPIVPTNQIPKPSGHTKNAYRPLSAMPCSILHGSNNQRESRNGRQDAPAAQATDRQTGRQNAEKK